WVVYIRQCVHSNSAVFFGEQYVVGDVDGGRFADDGLVCGGTSTVEVGAAEEAFRPEVDGCLHIFHIAYLERRRGELVIGKKVFSRHGAVHSEQWSKLRRDGSVREGEIVCVAAAVDVHVI